MLFAHPGDFEASLGSAQHGRAKASGGSFRCPLNAVAARRCLSFLDRSDAGSGALVLRVHRAKLFSDLPHLAHQPIIAVAEPSRRGRGGYSLVAEHSGAVRHGSNAGRIGVPSRLGRHNSLAAAERCQEHDAERPADQPDQRRARATTSLVTPHHYPVVWSRSPLSRKSLKRVVGATGIEPVTPPV